MKKNLARWLIAASVLLVMSASSAFAGPLKDRIKEGKPIRLGFYVAQPGSYLSDDGKPVGTNNVIALGILKKMGYTNIESETMDWGSLVPALQAGRVDIITAGMYVTSKRCETIGFSDPTTVIYNSVLVKKGNPKGLENYQDIAKKDAILAVISGYATIEQAKRAGIPEQRLMVFPGPTQAIAALKAGRVDAYVDAEDGVNQMAKESNGELEATNPASMPDRNYVAFGFRQNDEDFIAAFNRASADYIGTPEMLKDAKAYGYEDRMLPGKITSKEICKQS
ncbi:transporter substrate-binding domain-containing protein [Sinorhizobium fredii]|uniref:Ectoine/hydroxyectoine ABC transporter substrate-binding protein EhuB 1 n=1 Tax=Rhizobium fredii TaxID=380 RepID=A0A2L0HC26_RHIFR|nr:transporter substrate-binding domain-containing protein [Sinorhizobium fredii]AUX78994.1 ectoine/hydroxyectoine ABC transporter substrate-binding protein EhuB 1 [Sinorhizobium fredii]